MLVASAPAGRNIYSHGMTKSKAPSERHRKEYAALLGLFVVWVDGYKDVAPLALLDTHGSATLSSAAKPGSLSQGPRRRGIG